MPAFLAIPAITAAFEWAALGTKLSALAVAAYRVAPAINRSSAMINQDIAGAPGRMTSFLSEAYNAVSGYFDEPSVPVKSKIPKPYYPDLKM